MGLIFLQQTDNLVFYILCQNQPQFFSKSVPIFIREITVSVFEKLIFLHLRQS